MYLKTIVLDQFVKKKKKNNNNALHIEFRALVIMGYLYTRITLASACRDGQELEVTSLSALPVLFVLFFFYFCPFDVRT